MNIVHLVDDINYIETNCYQHQLQQAIKSVCEIRTATVVELSQTLKNVDLVISCLKQRTVNRLSTQIRTFVNDTPIVFYDQDPWQAYMDNSCFKGTYDLIRWPNLKAIAVTTKWWAEYITNEGLPGEFVKMGMLQRYCDSGPRIENRKNQVAFVGTLHPRRKRLFDELLANGVTVTTRPNNLSYAEYLTALHNIGIFIHNEDEPIVLNGKIENMGRGLWIKDVEAASRGCFSMRNNFDGAETYCDQIKTISCFNDPIQACDMIKQILCMNIDIRADYQRQAVETIISQNSWTQTANDLIRFGLR